jgi:hypothetical protein
MALLLEYIREYKLIMSYLDSFSVNIVIDLNGCIWIFLLQRMYEKLRQTCKQVDQYILDI